MPSDIYVNVAQYYTDMVKGYYTKSKKYRELPYCLPSSDSEYKPLQDREFDVLLYFKMRRGDNLVDGIKNDLCDKFLENGVNFHVIEYGGHYRETYLDAVKKSKMVVWLSIEDYCSLAQLEAYDLDTPIIGSKYNLTIPSCKDFLCECQKFDNWVRWRDDASDKIVSKCLEILPKISWYNWVPKTYLEDNHSPESYARSVERLLS